MELCLVVERACNLRCSYCYTGSKASQRMSRDTMRRAVDLALEYQTGSLTITLFGGEPLIYPQLLQEAEGVAKEAIASHGHPVQLRWLIDTNATLIDEAALEWLTVQQDAKLLVSMDGPARVHDKNRVDLVGRGSHARVAATVATLRARGFEFDFVAVANPNTCSDLGESLSHLLGYGAGRIVLQPNFHAQWGDSELGALERGVAAAAAVWGQEFREGRTVWVEPFHAKVLSHLAAAAPWPARCQLVTRELAIAPSGRIYPCAEMVGEDQTDDWVVGDVTQGVDFDRVQQLRSNLREVEQGCAECALNVRCTNHCGCRQIAVSGRLGALSAAYCRIEAAFIDATDEVAESLVAGGCTAFVDHYYHGNWALAPGALRATPLVQLRRRESR